MSTSPTGRLNPQRDPPIQNVRPPRSITAEVKAMLEDIRAVEQSCGKDARKARLLTITARALLTKLAESNPPVKFLLEGRIDNR